MKKRARVENKTMSVLATLEAAREELLNAPEEIPRVVHQTWKGPPSTLPAHWRESYEGWRGITDRGWRHCFWTDQDIDALIAQHYPWFLETFRAYEYGIQRADAFRYFVLHRYGGIYADLDISPKPAAFATFYQMVKHWPVVISRNKAGNGYGDQQLTNAFMMSRPGAGFWPEVWSYLKDGGARRPGWKQLAAARTHYFHVMFTTGPGVVNDAAASYPHPEEIYRAPPELTQPGNDQMKFPIDTAESVVRVLEGSSWHGPDAKFFRAAGQVINNAHWIHLAVTLVLAVLFFTFLGLFLHQRAKFARAVPIAGTITGAQPVAARE